VAAAIVEQLERRVASGAPASPTSAAMKV
jgi:hypothetical protein